jgi:hypothetical protein
MATPNSLTNLDDEYSFLRPYLEEEENKQKEEELSEEYSFLAPYMEKPKVAEAAAPKEEITEEYEFLRPYMEQSAPVRAPSLIRAEAPTLESLGVTLPQPPPPEEGILRQAADLPVQFAIGVNNSVKALTDLFGADNEVSQNLNQNVDWYRSLLSASSKQDEEEIGRILQDAEGKGMLGQLAAGLEAFTVAPADFVASGLGSLATFAATGLAGKAAAAARIVQTGVTGAKALATTERVVRGAQVATGMGMGAGIVKGQIYESVKEEMLAQGKTEEQARQVALEAQSYDGKNLPSILLGAGLGALDAFTGAEKVIGKILTKGGIAPNASRIGNIIQNGLTEGAPEFIQAAQEKLASNIALRNEGVEVGLTDGVFAQGALEGLVGVGMGLGAGAIEPRTQPATKEEVVAAASETQSAARQSSDVAPATASLVEGQAEKVIQERVGETITIPATVTPRREGETNQQWRARIERERAETPEQRVARLQEEATAAAGIELEEEGIGVEPPVAVTPPVEPTPEGAVAPVEPAVEPAVAEPQPAAEVAVEPVVTPKEPLPEDKSVTILNYDERVKPIQDQIDAKLDELEAGGMTFEEANQDPSVRALYEQRYAMDRGAINSYRDIVNRAFAAQGVTNDDLGFTPASSISEKVYGAPRKSDEGFISRVYETGQNAFNNDQATIKKLSEDIFKYRAENEGLDPAELLGPRSGLTDEGKKARVDEARIAAESIHNQIKNAMLEQSQAQPEALALPPAEVAPEVIPTPETIEPLRRVARAEQTEEDVSGLVGQGLVELYNGQPVITQAGLETLPEAERPRLNPEARKIQIDTGSNEVVAEAIAKNLRIGVDQVGTGVRLPAGWTLVEDIYVPPAKQEVAPAPEVRESRREDVRLNPLGYDIATVVEDIKAGRTDGPLRAVNNVIKQSQELRDRVQREAARRQEPRARGKAAILDRLSRERASGRISEETAQALTDFVNRIREDAIGDTALSIRKGGVSNFNFGETLVSFFLNQDQPATGARVGIHEFFHGLSRFLPDTEVEQMRQDYTKNLAEYLKKNPWFLAFVGRYSLTPEQFEEYKLFNPKEAETKLQPVKDRDGNIVKYQIKYDADNYRYIMLDEWIAEKMTDLVRSKQAVPDTFMGKIAKVIRDFLDLIKAKLGKDAYESFYQTITDPKQKLNLYRMSSVAEPFQIYQPQNFNYAEDVLDRIRYTRTERDPIITQAAMDLKEGKIDREEYQRIVDLRMPLEKFENVPVPASRSDIDRGLGNRTITRKDATGKESQILKRDLAQDPESISDGTIVESRLDIPAYENENVWVVSMHKPRPNLQKGAAGEVIAYTPTAVLRNVEFGVTEPAAINIAAGKPKSTIATMKGSYVPMTAQEAYDLANRGRSEGWVEVGMNPIRHSYFYDKDTQSPIVSAEEVVQVGGMVLAKNPVYGKRDDYRFMALGGEETGRFPTFETTSPEAATLSNMAASMAKVDEASEAKGGKPETYKISEIASVWMDQGGDTRQLQDLITENTNLTPANAKKVANAIAKQYGLQQSIAEARIETAEGVSLEGLPEGVTIPKEADPKRPKTVIQRLIDVTTGVRVKPTMLTVNEKTALKDQIRLKAAATREAKKAQQETANEVVDIIKAMELRGPVRPKQAQALAKRAAKVIWTSEKSMESFMAYAEKVVANTNYDADLREAKAAQKRALELSKRSTVASPQQEILANIAKIGVNMLDNPREFADVVNYYMRGFKPVVSPDYVVVPDDEVTSYLSQAEDIVEEARAEFDRVVTQRLSEKYGVSPDKIQSILDAQDIERALTQYAKREVAEAILNEKANEVLAGLKAYDQTGLRADQRKIIDSILKLDPSLLSSQERQQFVRTGNNIIFNNQTHGAELFAVTAKGQQMAKEAASNEELIAKNKAWVDVLPSIGSRTLQKTWRNWALELQSVADTFRNAFGKGSMAKVYRMMGMYDLDRGFTAAANTVNQIQEEVGAFYNKLEKKYKDAARSQDGILAEGIVGFLIQKVPEKGEVESLAQRRDLIQQDIRNRRISNDPDRVEMADRIERILQQLDGESVAAIMSNLKRDYRANHESLTWLKDQLLPKYKDFLKNFDENFNDQANNYENPDYLPIGFIRSGPSLAITPENEALYYEHVSLRPKQSSYTIKRADYTKLPTDKTTNKPKEIEFNLRRNTFDSLSDQVNKAYTSPAWQQIFAFMKTPESEKLFGGMANKEFFIERLNRLRLSRMRRGSMSSGYIEKTADALSVMARKIGTGIALGGFYQPAKQAPDQIIAVVGTTGRADLLAENMSPSNLKAAKIFLDKFSIGRRGDASSGYKYINQMEGAQNKIERYLSESKWDAAKEQAGKVADVWLLALKKTDYVFAAGAWMTYYRAQLAKDGVKFQGWEQESKLLDTDTARQDAAAYAEQMTDIYQGSSDPTKMATFVQSGKSGWENLFKAIFVPFNSFAVQQRMRMYSDARDALLKSGDDRVKGAFGLAATIGGLLAFHSVRRFALPALTGVGVSMLYAAFGVDMDEPDEEKQKEDFTKRWRQFLGEFTANLLVGGTGQIVEAATVDSFNYAAYLIAMQTEDETVLNDKGEIMSFSQYAKERSPFWRYRSFDNAMSLGMFDIGIDQGKKAILETKTLMTPEEMENFTTEEQRLLYFAAISDWLYLMRLNDADFSRMVDRARREIKARSKETEKELARIRAGR